MDFRDLFGKSESSEHTDSGGASVKVSIESEQDIEGVAKFKESRSRRKRTPNFRKPRGPKASQEQEGEEGTVVKAGTRARITETRQRADGDGRDHGGRAVRGLAGVGREALRREVRGRPQRPLEFPRGPVGCRDR